MTVDIIHEIAVSKTKLESQISRLGSLYDSGQADLTALAANDFYFMPHPND